MAVVRRGASVEALRCASDEACGVGDGMLLGGSEAFRRLRKEPT